MKKQFYLSNVEDLQEVADLTGLTCGEVEDIVGRFKSHSNRAGQLRGQVWLYHDKVQIRHHFTKKKLWETKLLT